MSTLIGVPIPVNSVGTLPLSYLQLTESSKSKSILLNARQISQQFLSKLHLARRQAISFKPFPQLSSSDVADLLRKSQDAIFEEDFERSISISHQLINLSLKGLHYYHTYHRSFLYSSVILSYFGWISLTLISLLKRNELIANQVYKRSSLTTTSFQFYGNIFFIVVTFFTFSILFFLQMKFSYFVYCSLPIIIWYYVFRERLVLTESYKILQQNSILHRHLFISLFLIMSGIWILIIGFFYRFALTIFLWMIAFVFKRKHWKVLCFLLSIFPMLPVVGRSPNAFTVVFGGLLGSIFSFRLEKGNLSTKLFTLMPLICGIVAPLTIYLSDKFNTVPIFVHIFSWQVLFSSWFLPLLATKKLEARFIVVLVGHLSSYILLSLSYDSIFCSLFCFLLFSWVECEKEEAIKQKTNSAESNLSFCKFIFQSNHLIQKNLFKQLTSLSFQT